MSNTRKVVMVALGLVAAGPGMTRAQGIWPGSAARYSLALETLHPSVEFGEVKFPTSATFLRFRAGLTGTMAIVAEQPFAHYAEEQTSGTTLSSTVLGNTYVGLELGSAGSPVSVELGLRVPTSTELGDGDGESRFIGAFTDLERLEAFMEDAVSASANVAYRKVSAAGFGIQARGGVTGIHLTGEEIDDEANELLASYGLKAWQTVGRARIGGGLGGRLFATEEGSFGERSMHWADGFMSYGIGSVRPGVVLRVPLDGIDDVIEFVVGVGFEVTWR